MVKFELINQSELILRYRYYPEDDRDKAPGLIIVDRVKETIYVEKSAEFDSLSIFSASDMNSMRDSINEMRAENGEPPLTEAELPTAVKSEIWYTYAGHAIRKITESYNKGIILPKGISFWY